MVNPLIGSAGDHIHRFGRDIEVTIHPAVFTTGLASVRLAWLDHIENTWPHLMLLVAALKTAGAAIIYPNRVTVMKVFWKRVMHPMRSHQLKSAPFL